MAGACDAREWLTENLADPRRQHDNGADYYPVVVAYIAGLPDDDPQLLRVAGLLETYDRGPGRRPDISLNGDDEDTADVLMQILDNEETTSGLDGDTEDDGSGVHGLPPLSRESPAAFLHDLVESACDWLADEAAEVDR